MLSVSRFASGLSLRTPKNLSPLLKINARCVSNAPIPTSQGFKSLSDQQHFKLSIKTHPFVPSDSELGDHTGRQQNHIWTMEEINDIRANMYKHKPNTISDHIANKVMYMLYHTFNWITGYRHKDPTPESIGWRLICLESVAGVPGFLAAGFRHFHSLRTLQKDHGWIYTLLEEAENERMHLMICMQVFDASLLTRAMVISAQVIMTSALALIYSVHPKFCHRFVGYLEETAVHTYDNVITHTETPGTLLHTAWKDLKAPPNAIAYYRLDPDSKFVDVLKCMMADEAHHRDVNHTFALLKGHDPNPFLITHKEDAARAWRLENSGAYAWKSKTVPIGSVKEE